MTFSDLQLITPLLKAVEEEGYTTPTPIQEKAIPGILEGRDLLGCAQTGTGKTAAFALPVLQRLQEGPRPQGRRPIRVLALAPTRELANQVADSFKTYGRHTGVRQTVIYGGVGQNPQVSALRRGIEIVVATPGRLLDLMNQGYVHLDQVEVLILDEADRMLDMGFMPDIKRIVGKIPNKRQTLMFSATMPDEIRHFASNLLTDPLNVSVAPVAATADRIEQSLYYVEKENKSELLMHLLGEKAMSRVLVFSRTKHGADRIVKKLNNANFPAEAIHGNKSQSKREFALRKFKQGRVQVLVATDIAARGLDIDSVSHVFNYDLPNDTESFVHRIGRTARAGASGEAIAFCAKDEHGCLRDIQKLINLKIPVVEEHPYRSEHPAPLFIDERPGRPRGRGRSSQGGQSGSRGQSAQGGRRGGRGSRKPWERDSGSSNSSGGGNRSRSRSGRPHRKGQSSSSSRAEARG